ncbi:MAG TPA: hypothetical protein DCS93_31650 [Microscillaceae bacterium]|nr:hypothetical protein [Microscillaceae bacterium]
MKHFLIQLFLVFFLGSRTYFALGQIPDSVKQEQVIDSLKQLLNTNLSQQHRFKSYLELGNNYSQKKSYPEALENYQLALKIAKQTNDSSGIAKSYYYLSFIYYNYDQSLLKKAKGLLQKSISIQLSLNELSKVAQDYIALSAIAHAEEQYSSSIQFLHEALKIYQQLKNHKNIAFIYHLLGSTHLDNFAYSKAMDYYRKALNGYKKLNDQSQIALIYQNIGVFYDLQGEQAKALQYLFRALKIIQKLNQSELLTKIYSNIAVIYNKQDDYQTALNYFSKTLTLAKKLKNQFQIAYTKSDIGFVYLKQGSFTKASQYFQQALLLSIQIRRNLLITRCQVGLGKLRLAQKKYGQAQEFFEQALTTKSKLILAQAFIGLGASFHYQHQNQLALLNLEQGVAAAQQIRNVGLQVEAYGILNQVYYLLGNFKQAYQKLDSFRNIKDSLFNIKKIKEIARIKTRFDSLQKDKIIETKNKELALLNKKEQEKRHQIQMFFFFILYTGYRKFGYVFTPFTFVKKAANYRKKPATILSDTKVLSKVV